MRTLLLALTLALVVSPYARAEDGLSARQILDRSLDTEAIGFQSAEVGMTLLITDRGGQTRERRMIIRGRRDDDRFAALVRVTGPAEVAGQAYLFRENPGATDDVFVYLPAIDEAPRRIAGAQRNSSFMGTNFTYADLQRRDMRDAQATRQPNETVGRFETYVIDVTPTAGADVDYARARLWIRTTDDVPLRIRFFDRQGAELRTMFTEQTGTTGNRTYIRRLTLRDRDGSSTTMIIDHIDDSARMDAAEFTPDNLTR